MNKGIVSVIIIVIILLVTAVTLVFLILNKKSSQNTQNIAKSAAVVSNQVNNNSNAQNIAENEKMAEKIKQMQAQRRTAPPQGFLSIELNKLPSGCTLKSSGFTDTVASYHYECTADPFPYNINISEDSGKTLDTEVKRETESKIQNLKPVKEFSFQNSKGVIVGTFANSDTQLKDLPIEYRLYWMHNKNLITLHANRALTITPDKLIELLGLMK